MNKCNFCALQDARPCYECSLCQRGDDRFRLTMTLGENIKPKPQTNAAIIASNVEDIDCLAELIWNDCWSEIFNIPEFDTKQELADWLRQPKDPQP